MDRENKNRQTEPELEWRTGRESRQQEEKAKMKFLTELLSIVVIGPLAKNVTHDHHDRSLFFDPTSVGFYVDMDYECIDEYNLRLQESLVSEEACLNVEFETMFNEEDIVPGGEADPVMVCKAANAFFHSMSNCLSTKCKRQLCDVFDTIEDQINVNLVQNGGLVCDDLSCGFFSTPVFFTMVIGGPIVGICLLSGAGIAVYFLRKRKLEAAQAVVAPGGPNVA